MEIEQSGISEKGPKRMVIQQVKAGIDTNIFVAVINKEEDYLQSKRVLDWIDNGRIKGIVSTIVLAEM